MSHHYSGPDWGFPKGDARLDLTDLYAFPKPRDSSKSILIMNVHPSVHDYLDHEDPLGPTTAEPFASEALYELKIDTDGDAVADIAYRVRFSSSKGKAQTATLRRVEGAQAAGAGDGGQALVEGAPVSTGREARVTEAGDYRFFAGWRSDPFFFDRLGAINNLTAFRFINQQGLARYGRYRIAPQAGVEHLDDATAKAKDENYLFEELTHRIAAGPIRLDIHVQIANDSDVVDDATIHWPSDRPSAHFGTIVLTEKAPDDEEHRRLIFDPIPRVDGIEPSDDPLLELRAAIYLLSGRRRRQAAES